MTKVVKYIMASCINLNTCPNHDVGSQGSYIPCIMLAIDHIGSSRMSIVNRKLIVEVIREDVTSNGNLVKVVLTLRHHCLPLGHRQRRQQHRRQDGYDGDDHQQFNEGEPACSLPAGIFDF